MKEVLERSQRNHQTQVEQRMEPPKRNYLKETIHYWSPSQTVSDFWKCNIFTRHRKNIFFVIDLLSSVMHQNLYASMIKMNYHPDLATLNQFEKLILALGRWPQFFTISLVVSETNVSSFTKESIELGKVIESWRALHLDPIEYRLIEILSLTGRGEVF